LLNISISVFAANAHIAEGRVLGGEPTAKRGKFVKLLAGTRMPTDSITEGKHLK